MPQLTLTLNGQPVDLPADAAVALSYRAKDLRNIDGHDSSFSQSFTLPLTARNVAVLGAPHSLDSLTPSPYMLLPAVLTSAGGVVLLNGFAILELSHEGYDVTLTDALGGLFAQVEGLDLADLDLSAFDHAYTYDAVAESQNRGYAEGYVYALADDGRLTNRDPSKGVLFYELRLSTYYHAILRAIVAQALPGYQVIGSLLAEQTYRAAMLPQPTAYPRLAKRLLTDSSASGRLPITRPYPGAGIRENQYVAVQFAAEKDPGGHLFAGTFFTPPDFQADLTVRVRARVQLTVIPGALPLTAIALLTLRDSNQPQGQTAPVGEHGVYHTTQLHAGNAVDVPAGPISVDFSVRIPGLKPGQLLFLELAYVNVSVRLLAGASISFEVGERVYPGGPISLAANLPDMKQLDFIKLACNQFNLILQADSVFKQLRLDLLNDVDRNRNQVVDWTEKLDLATRPKLAYRLGDYAQANTLAYEAPPDQYEELASSAAQLTGAEDLLVANTALPARAEAYTAPLLLPEAHPALAETQSLLWLPLVREPDDLVTAAEPWVADKTYGDSKTPVVYNSLLWQGTALVAGTVPGSSGSTSAGVWQEVSYASENESLAAVALLAPLTVAGLVVRADAPRADSFPPAWGLARAGLSFTELLPTYYPVLSSALARARLLTVNLRLTALDIAALDYTLPIRLRLPAVQGYGRLACLGYLNDIDQYLPGVPVSVPVTLLVLGDPVPGLAPPVPFPAPATHYGFIREAGDYYLLSEAGEYLLTEAD